MKAVLSLTPRYAEVFRGSVPWTCTSRLGACTLPNPLSKKPVIKPVYAGAIAETQLLAPHTPLTTACFLPTVLRLHFILQHWLTCPGRPGFVKWAVRWRCIFIWQLMWKKSLALPYNMRECSVDALGSPGDPYTSKSLSKPELAPFMQWGWLKLGSRNLCTFHHPRFAGYRFLRPVTQ